MSVNSAVECTGFTLGAEWADSLVTGNNWGSRSSLCPGPNELPRRGHAWLWLRSFDSPALVFSADQNLSERRAAASWRCDAPVRMTGGMREAVLSGVRQAGHIVHHCASEWGADCGSKVLGSCERGWKGASASEAVAEYSMVGRAKAGACARRGCCGSRAR